MKTVLSSLLLAVAVFGAALADDTKTEDSSIVKPHNITYINADKSISYLPDAVCDWWTYRYEASECGFLEARPPALKYAYCKFLHTQMNFKLLGTTTCYKRSCNGYGDDIGQCYPTASCRRADARGLCNKGTVCCTSRVVIKGNPSKKPRKQPPKKTPGKKKNPRDYPRKRVPDFPNDWPRLPDFPNDWPRLPDFPNNDWPDRKRPELPGRTFPRDFPRRNFPRDIPGRTFPRNIPRRGPTGSSESNESK